MTTTDIRDYKPGPLKGTAMKRVVCLLFLAVCVAGCSQATQVPTTPTPAQHWTTSAQMFGGYGILPKTESFGVPNDWKIVWACTYENIGGVTTDGALVVTVYSADTHTLLDVAVNATCKHGVARTTGQTEEHQGGQVYLSVGGASDWTMVIQFLE